MKSHSQQNFSIQLKLRDNKLEALLNNAPTTINRQELCLSEEMRTTCGGGGGGGGGGGNVSSDGGEHKQVQSERIHEWVQDKQHCNELAIWLAVFVLSVIQI